MTPLDRMIADLQSQAEEARKAGDLAGYDRLTAEVERIREKAAAAGGPGHSNAQSQRMERGR